MPRHKGSTATREGEDYVQLATRIPKALHRAIKLHCVGTETSVMDFVIAAIERKLTTASGTDLLRRTRPGNERSPDGQDLVAGGAGWAGLSRV